MRKTLVSLNIALRGLMEFGIILAFGYWGYQLASNMLVKILLAILIPLGLFGFWGLVDFHQAGRWAEPLRLFQEMVLSLLAAAALFAAGQPLLGWILAILSIVQHILVYSLGETLLKHAQA